jgi:hypothetical protein
MRPDREDDLFNDIRGDGVPEYIADQVRRNKARNDAPSVGEVPVTDGIGHMDRVPFYTLLTLRGD